MRERQKLTLIDGCHWASNKEALGSCSQQSWIPAAVPIHTQVYRNVQLMGTV